MPDLLYSSITAELESRPEFDDVGVFLGSLPQEPVLPALRFSVVSRTYIGVSHDGAGLVRCRVQFDGVHQYLDVAADVRKKVFDALNNFRGVMGSGLTIQSCLPTGSGRDLYDERTTWWLAQQDWNLEYQESA